jgi:photosystem II stability/assembly factor-like uncharacterized protein
MALSHSHVAGEPFAGEPSVVYESADGVSWTEVDDVQEAPSGFVPSEFDWALGGPRLVRHDRTWVIAQESFETLASVAWTSTDDGRSWERWTLAESEDARIHDLVVIEDVIVAIGFENKSGAPSKLYYSEDAENWKSVRPIHDLHDLDWLDGNIIALGDGGGAVFTWSSPTEQATPD